MLIVTYAIVYLLKLKEDIGQDEQQSMNAQIAQYTHYRFRNRCGYFIQHLAG